MCIPHFTFSLIVEPNFGERHVITLLLFKLLPVCAMMVQEIPGGA